MSYSSRQTRRINRRASRQRPNVLRITQDPTWGHPKGVSQLQASLKRWSTDPVDEKPDSIVRDAAKARELRYANAIAIGISKERAAARLPISGPVSSIIEANVLAGALSLGGQRELPRWLTGLPKVRVSGPDGDYRVDGIEDPADNPVVNDIVHERSIPQMRLTAAEVAQMQGRMFGLRPGVIAPLPPRKSVVRRAKVMLDIGRWAPYDYTAAHASRRAATVTLVVRKEDGFVYRGQGSAVLTPGDTYLWKTGESVALERALRSAGILPGGRLADAIYSIWRDEFYRHQIPLGGWRRINRRVTYNA